VAQALLFEAEAAMRASVRAAIVDEVALSMGPLRERWLIPS